MSSAASAHPAPKPCGRVPALWSSYFFTNVPGSAKLPDGTQKFPPRNDLAGNEVRCSKCGCTIDEHRPEAALMDEEHDEESRTVDKQMSALLLLREAFDVGNRIFGTVHASSDKLTEIAQTQPWLAELMKESHPCVVCGWKQGDENAAYPGDAARRHAVSVAHIIPNAKQCAELALPFDQTNFLLLCGGMDEVPSCHSAFDRRLLCFVKQPGEGHHFWKVHASANDYKRFDGKVVDLSFFKPHRRALHSHAYACLNTGQIVPFPLNVADLDTAPPDVDDDPAPPADWGDTG